MIPEVGTSVGRGGVWTLWLVVAGVDGVDCSGHWEVTVRVMNAVCCTAGVGEGHMVLLDGVGSTEDVCTGGEVPMVPSSTSNWLTLIRRGVWSISSPLRLDSVSRTNPLSPDVSRCDTLSITERCVTLDDKVK